MDHDLVAGLESRLALLEDDRNIQQTMARYGHALDHGDETGFMDLWTPSAVLDWPLSGRLVGLDEIRRGFRGHSYAPERIHKHLMVELIVHIIEGAPTVLSMFVRVDLEPDQPTVHAFGRYKDRLHRCDDQMWRFTHLEALAPSVDS